MIETQSNGSESRTKNCHHEIELVIAIAKGGFRIPEAEALDHVFGYACGLDMTRRDLQAAAKEKQRPWDLGKDFEQSAVLGEIAPAADIGHSRDSLDIRIRLAPPQPPQPERLPAPPAVRRDRPLVAVGG